MSETHFSDKTYTVEVTREGDAWVADVTNLAGAHTFARSFSAMKREVDEVIRLMEELNDDVDLFIRFQYVNFDQDFVDLAALGERRLELEDLSRELGIATVVAVQNNVGKYSTRDVAAAVGLTPGRVSQLANADK